MATTPLDQRISEALQLNHPMDTALATQVTDTVMSVLAETQIPDPDGSLRNEPQNRLERMANYMTDCLDTHPEHTEDVRCVVFMTDGNVGGLVAHGYDHDEKDDGTGAVTSAFADVLAHLRAMMRSIGKDMELIAIPDDLSTMRSADGT